jgi:beta-galactosidase
MLRRGVRYYRAVPPPEGEWELDYATLARSGFGFVVVPVPWALSHVADDGFDFSPLLRQLGLAHEHGLQVVAAIGLSAAPAWLMSRHRECFYEDAEGRKILPGFTWEAPCGGWPGLCLDNEAVRGHAGRFLRALASAALGHPALAAYDVSGYRDTLELLFEESSPDKCCYCAGSRSRFVAWVRRAYGDDLDALGRAWNQRFVQWSDVAPPTAFGLFPLDLDWRRFLAENASAHLQWCAATVREADPGALVIPPASLLGQGAPADADAVSVRIGSLFPWAVGIQPHEAADCLAPAASGKRVWLVDFPADDVRRMRRAHWSALAAGPDALVYDAWRPERLGEFCRAALARPDGRPTERLEEANWLGGLLERNPQLAAARPCPAEVAVLVLAESRVFRDRPFHEEGRYAQALRGAYRALSSRGARVVFAGPDALAPYPLVYAPLAVAMSRSTAEALRRYVEGGGHLVAEACTGRIDEHGVASRTSPGHGLEEVFGARGLDVRDLAFSDEKLTFRGRRGSFSCYFTYEPLEATTGVVKARFADGTAAIVDHTLGAGATRLIGTHPSLGCAADDTDNKSHMRVVLDSLAFARMRPRVLCSTPEVCVRLLRGEGGVRFLCAFNTSEKSQEATVRVSRSIARFRSAANLLTGKYLRLLNNGRRIRLPRGEGIILRLETNRPRRRWRRGRGLEEE